jgi:hypothetical protein
MAERDQVRGLLYAMMPLDPGDGEHAAPALTLQRRFAMALSNTRAAAVAVRTGWAETPPHPRLAVTAQVSQPLPVHNALSSSRRPVPPRWNELGGHRQDHQRVRPGKIGQWWAVPAGKLTWRLPLRY